MQRHLITACVLVLMLVVSAAYAQIPLNISYQARLSDHDTGEPVPDATYPMEFRFYADSTGGTPVWTENYSLPTNNGFFNARLGGMDGLNLNNLGGRVFMEVAVNSEVMIPRAPFQHVPYSAIAQRVMGDIITGQGQMIVTNSNGDSSFSILSDAGTGMVSVKMIHPPEGPSFELSSDGINNQISMKMIHPPEGPGVEMIADGVANTMNFRLVHPPEQPAVDILSDAGNNRTTFRLVHPPEAPGVEILSDAGSNSVDFRLIHPPERSIIEMSGTPDNGASIYMFNPQPEPPAEPLLLMNTTASGASLAMTAPQTGGLSTDIANPLLRFQTDSNGGAISFFDEAGQYMGVEPTPFTPGGLLMMIDPAADDTTIKLLSEGEIIVSNNTNHLASRLSPGSLLMQYELSATVGPPIFMEATALDAKVGIGTETPEFRLDLKSSGTGDGMRVSGSSGNQLFRIRQNSDGSCETQVSDLAGATKVMIRANGATYFTGGNVGIGTTSPADKLHIVGNIRMVDGNQATGKVLTSDANGVGTWQPVTALVGEQMQELLNIIEKQNAKIAALENRLSELEQR